MQTMTGMSQVSAKMGKRGFDEAAHDFHQSTILTKRPLERIAFLGEQHTNISTRSTAAIRHEIEASLTARIPGALSARGSGF